MSEVTIQRKGKRALTNTVLVLVSAFASSGGTAAFVNKEDQTQEAAQDTRLTIVETKQKGMEKTIDEIKWDVKELLRRIR